MQKITIAIPSDLKNKIEKLQEELEISIDTIFTNALKEYIQNQEMKKWKNGAKLASKDKKYMKLCQELDNAI